MEETRIILHTILVKDSELKLCLRKIAGKAKHVKRKRRAIEMIGL